MKSHKALEQLQSIIRESDESQRIQKLMEWEKQWIQSVERSQYIVNKSVLTSDETDFVWYNLMAQCAEDLLDDNLVETDMTNQSVTAKIWALRRSDEQLKADTKNIKKSG